MYLCIIKGAGSFYGLLNLREIDLSFNRISSMEPGSLAFFKLTRLDLTSNRIFFINEYLFNILQQLNSLMLNDNQLVDINAPSFRWLTNLQYLFLRNNMLMSVDSYSLAPLKRLEYVDIAENPVSITNPEKASSLCTYNPNCYVNFKRDHRS
jgi:Leucine-rich repeat (LRR) protein